MFSGSYWKPTQTANKLDAAIVGQGYIGKT